MANIDGGFWNGIARFQPLLMWLIVGTVTCVMAFSTVKWGVNSLQAAMISTNIEMDRRFSEFNAGGSGLAVRTSARVDVLEKSFLMHMENDAKRMDDINKKLDTLIGLHTKP
jgi:hypothetical protein